MSSYLPQLLAVLVPVGVQLVLFLCWLHRRIRDDEINRAFVYDVATNHLPHIYDALRAIAEQQEFPRCPARGSLHRFERTSPRNVSETAVSNHMIAAPLEEDNYRDQ